MNFSQFCLLQETLEEREMEAACSMILVLIILLLCAWKMLNWLWFTPKRLDRVLREQGIEGTPYKFFVGDTKESAKMRKEAFSKPMDLFSHDIGPRVYPFFHHSINTHGKNSFSWFGPIPRLTLTDPELIKDVLNKMNDFGKLRMHPQVRFIASGLVSHEGERWSKHRKIINPAFHLEKLKNMFPLFIKCCDDLISKWEEMLSSNGSSEIDVWPFCHNLASDAISRTAFGSSYEEGRRIFQLLTEQTELTVEIMLKVYIPGWRFVPTATHRRMKAIDKEVKSLLTNIINNRLKALKTGEATRNDLLGILLESNQKEIQEQGNNKKIGLSNEDVIAECKLFYFAGHETTSSLLVWTMILLSMYPDWQTRARKEILQVFCNRKPDFDGLKQLKIVTMILNEVLRLYPPVVSVVRRVCKDVKLGNLSLPAGVQVHVPIVSVHHDRELWGDDFKEFKPERFAEGVLKATNGRASLIPFGGGPRICIGQNFSMLEVKIALSMILQRFSFELSPTYTHAPTAGLTLQPQYGAHLILRKVET